MKVFAYLTLTALFRFAFVCFFVIVIECTSKQTLLLYVFSTRQVQPSTDAVYLHTRDSHNNWYVAMDTNIYCHGDYQGHQWNLYWGSRYWLVILYISGMDIVSIQPQI